jgi:hypothetical protein
MTTQRKLLSICVPVFNEQDNIVPLYERVCSVMGEIADRYDFEMVFTDNHSIDRTFEELAALARKDPRVRVIRFSRNFGFQKSILTNYLNARRCGDPDRLRPSRPTGNDPGVHSPVGAGLQGGLWRAQKASRRLQGASTVT